MLITNFILQQKIPMKLLQSCTLLKVYLLIALVFISKYCFVSLSWNISYRVNIIAIIFHSTDGCSQSNPSFPTSLDSKISHAASHYLGNYYEDHHKVSRGLRCIVAKRFHSKYFKLESGTARLGNT